ncbi:MAG: hypothetical protein AAGL99_02535 [Pseudomonadota bacterium]
MPKTPSEALGDFLEVLRREFEANPEFAHRAVKALGADIELRGTEAAKAINPVELVYNKGADGARVTLSSFSVSKLKKIATNANLATSFDLKNKDSEEIVELIVSRAKNKIGERGA